jgi:hypothetical protein
MIKTVAVFSILFFLNACSSIKNAGVAYHDSFDFSAVQSYSFYDRNSSFTEVQSLLDSRRNTIEMAIEKAMANQEFSYVEVEQADVIVAYHVLKGSRTDYSSYNKWVHFCPHCLRASAWIKDNKYSAATHGSLIVDIVDPKKKRSVWRSIYPLNIKGKDNSAKSNDKIQQAVATMLAQYPTTNTKRK